MLLIVRTTVFELKDEISLKTKCFDITCSDTIVFLQAGQRGVVVGQTLNVFAE